MNLKNFITGKQSHKFVFQKTKISYPLICKNGQFWPNYGPKLCKLISQGTTLNVFFQTLKHDWVQQIDTNH